jgi:MFS superfamily sulfate permease-like transporter
LPERATPDSTKPPSPGGFFIYGAFTRILFRAQRIFFDRKAFVSINSTPAPRSPQGATVIVDATRADFVDHDVRELLDAFVADAPRREIAVDVRHQAQAQARAARGWSMRRTAAEWFARYPDTRKTRKTPC